MHNSACFFPVFFARIFLSLEWHPCCCIRHSYCSRPVMLLATLAVTGVLAAVYVRDVPVVSEAVVVPAFSHFLNAALSLCCCFYCILAVPGFPVFNGI
jgi:hypothetical protein